MPGVGLQRPRLSHQRRTSPWDPSPVSAVAFSWGNGHVTTSSNFHPSWKTLVSAFPSLTCPHFQLFFRALDSSVIWELRVTGTAHPLPGHWTFSLGREALTRCCKTKLAWYGGGCR